MRRVHAHIVVLLRNCRAERLRGPLVAVRVAVPVAATLLMVLLRMSDPVIVVVPGVAVSSRRRRSCQATVRITTSTRLVSVVVRVPWPVPVRPSPGPGTCAYACCCTSAGAIGLWDGPLGHMYDGAINLAAMHMLNGIGGILHCTIHDVGVSTVLARACECRHDHVDDGPVRAKDVRQVPRIDHLGQAADLDGLEGGTIAVAITVMTPRPHSCCPRRCASARAAIVVVVVAAAAAIAVLFVHAQASCGASRPW